MSDKRNSKVKNLKNSNCSLVSTNSSMAAICYNFTFDNAIVTLCNMCYMMFIIKYEIILLLVGVYWEMLLIKKFKILNRGKSLIKSFNNPQKIRIFGKLLKTFDCFSSHCSTT